MKALIVIVGVMVSLNAVAGFNLDNCKNGAAYVSKKLPYTENGVTLISAWCYKDAYNVEISSPLVNKWNKLSTESRRKLYNRVFDNLIPELCSDSNRVWGFTDQINVIFTNGKDKLAAAIGIKRALCAQNKVKNLII